MKISIAALVFLTFPLQLFCMGNDYLKLLKKCAYDQEKFQQAITYECYFPEMHKETRKDFLAHMGYPDQQFFDDNEELFEPSIPEQMQAFQGIIGNSDIGEQVTKALQQYDGLNVEHKTTIEKYCDAQSIAGAVIGELPTSLINIAIEKKNKNAVELLLQKNKEHALFIEGDSLYRSPEKKLATGGLGIVTLVAQHNSNIIADMAKDKGILFDAIRGNNIAFAQYLVERGADINAYETNGSNPVIMTALTCGHHQGMQDFVLFLLGREGIDINCSDPVTKDTPLHVAVRNSYVEVIKALLAKTDGDGKIDTNKQNVVGDTPLHIAASYSGAEQFRLLAESILVDCNIENKAKRMPLHCVVENAAVLRNDDSKMKQLLRRLLDINATDQWGFTALHRAADSGHAHLVPLLLAYRYGAVDVNARTTAGKTALDLIKNNAKHFDSYRTIEQLLLANGGKYSEDLSAKETTLDQKPTASVLQKDNGNKKEGLYILYGGVMLTTFIAAIIALMHMYNVTLADIISYA